MKKKIIITVFFSLFLAFAGITFFIKNATPVQLVYMVDSKYVPYMTVSLYSAIKNKNKFSRYNVHIIADNLSREEQEEIKKLEDETIKISFYPTRKLDLDFSHLGRFASFKTALQKLFIAEYLSNIDKVLYIDADTLVQSDLSEVYNMPLRGYYVAAVKDGLMYQFPEHIREINLEWRKFYFNSGIMLLNLNKIREDKVMDEAVRYFHTNYEVFGDQDVLNVVFGDKVQKLSYRYNCNSTFFEEKSAKFLSNFYDEPIPNNTREVYENAVILHFAGHKPWTIWFNHSYLKPLWQSYEKETQKRLHK